MTLQLTRWLAVVSAAGMVFALQVAPALGQIISVGGKSFSCQELHSIGEDTELAEVFMDSKKTAVNLQRLLDNMKRVVERDIQANIDSVRNFDMTSLKLMKDSADRTAAALAAKSGLGKLAAATGISFSAAGLITTASLAILEKTVGARGGITGIQQKGQLIRNVSVLESLIQSHQQNAEAIFQLQVQAKRLHQQHCR